MKHIKSFLFFLLLSGFSITILHAQEINPAAGGNSTGSGGTASYSIGQVVYTNVFGTNGSLIQGIQQPYEISVITGIERTFGITIECSVYPNPTTDFLVLKIVNYNKEQLSYQLFDINGKLLINKKVEGNETTIDMTGYFSSSYFLKVSDNNKEIKTFKIIKN